MACIIALALLVMSVDRVIGSMSWRERGADFIPSAPPAANTTSSSCCHWPAHARADRQRSHLAVPRLELTGLPTYVMVAMSRGSVRPNRHEVLLRQRNVRCDVPLRLRHALRGDRDGRADRMPVFAEQADHGGISTIGIVGMILALLGIGFKLAAVPMHLYAKDVYEGAAVHVTAFLGFVPKAAGAVAFMLLLSTLGWGDGMSLPAPILILLWVMSVLTMTLGNIAALLQKSVKRMLACSSIAHSGYLLIGIIAGPGLGYNAVVLYLFIYGLGNTASFATAAWSVVGMNWNRWRIWPGCGTDIR